MTDYLNTIKIPQDRVAVLIGKEGETKTHLEKITETSLDVDSKEGEISVSGDDPLKLFTGVEIIRAIGRGVNPDIAFRLNKIDYVLEIISILDYAKTKNDLARLKGRVIGKDGKARRVIEDLLDITITVYGKTICLIGRGDDIVLARRGMDALLSGSSHSTVYQMLERLKKKSRQAELKESAGF